MTRATKVMGALLAAGSLALGACGAAEADDDVTAIDFYYPIQVGGPLEDTINGFIDEFEEQNPDIEVTPVYSGDYNQTLAAVRAASQAGDTPAAAVLMSTELYALTDEDLIVPVQEIEDDPEWFGSFYDAFMANSVLDGTVASIPFQRSTVVQFWNKEHFEQAGLDPEVPPATWDELMEMGKQVQEGSDAQWGVQIPSDNPNGAWLMQALTVQNGLEIASDDGKEVYFDDPRAVEALEYWVSLADEGVSPSGTISWGTLPDDFASGGTSVIWTTTGQLSNIRSQADFDFGVSVLPANERPGSPTGGGNIYIFKDTTEEEQQAALKLARFLSSPELQAEWTVASGYVAPLEAAWEVDELAAYAEEFPPSWVAIEQLPNAVGEMATHRRGEIEETLLNGIGAALNGEDAGESMRQAQETADGILAEYQQ